MKDDLFTRNAQAVLDDCRRYDKAVDTLYRTMYGDLRKPTLARIRAGLDGRSAPETTDPRRTIDEPVPPGAHPESPFDSLTG